MSGIKLSFGSAVRTALLTSMLFVNNTGFSVDLSSILSQSNIKGGLIVHMGPDKAENISLESQYLYRGLSTDSAKVLALQKSIRETGHYGRLSAAVYDGKKFPYADNMVNLLIIEDAANVSQSEINRVVVPDGCIARKSKDGWNIEKKARPKEMDDWPQWQHGPDNVLVSKDTLVGPPRRLKWMANPPWSRMHNDIDVPASCNLILSSNGRMFYDADQGFPDSDKMPARFSLLCRDAFNGKLLWERPLTDWYKDVEYRRGNPPAVIQRRIVCDGERLYATFSSDGPVQVLDAATGKTLKTLAGTEGTHEVVLSDGKLFLVIWTYSDPVRDGYTRRGGYKSEWHAGEIPNDIPEKEKPRYTPFYRQVVQTSLKVIDLSSGKQTWARDDQELKHIFPQTLAVDGDRAFCKTPEKLYCLDATSGKTVWTSDIGLPLEEQTRIGKWYWVNKPTPWYFNLENISRVNVLKDKVLTVLKDRLYAVSKKDGKILWSTPCAHGFVSPADIFPVRETLYVTKKGYQAIDLETGERSKSLSLGATGMGHPRCYRRIATEKYIMSSTGGIEFMDPQTGKYLMSQWTRGNCFSGFIPANGLTYVTPHPCACFTRTRMNGMLAYEGESKTPPEKFNRHVKGPAYGQKADTLKTAEQDWPMYRQNIKRGGSSAAVVSPELATAWKVKLGTKLSPLSTVGDIVYVAAVDEHTVYALDAASGDIRWSYVTSGRVDTPPTIHGDYAVFGSKDGWTYCLNKDSGKLVWRFHGGPQERLIGAFDQLESSWPVHGSVLIMRTATVNEGNPVVYTVAGRNTFLDSGLHVYALDLSTGNVVANNNLNGPYGEDGNPILDGKQNIKGVKADFLVSDGNFLYIKDFVMNMDCSEATTKGVDHLVATGRSLLDGYWHHRSLWVLNRETPYSPGRRRHAGHLMAFGDSTILSFRSHSGGRNSTFSPAEGYQLGCFKINKEAQAKQATATEIRRGAAHITDEAWKLDIDTVCKAMVLTGERYKEKSEGVLFIAGTKNLKDPLLVEAALQNKKGGVLQAYSVTDGKVLAEYELTSLPVYDGLAVSGSGQLFIAQEDGQLLCMKKKD